MITSNLDIAIGIILIVFSTCGLIRGFLKEISSVVNWFGSFYLTSIIKPFIRPFFEDKIQIPFLLDTVMNVVTFVVLIIIISVITNYISITLKKIIPSGINGSIGMLCGFLRGFLVSAIIIAFVKIVYDKTNDKPEWIENSHIYNSISYDGNIFVNMLNNIFGDYKKEEQREDTKNKEYLNNRFRQSDEKRKKEFDRVFDIINENYEDEFVNESKNIDNTDKDIITHDTSIKDVRGIVRNKENNNLSNTSDNSINIINKDINDNINKSKIVENSNNDDTVLNTEMKKIKNDDINIDSSNFPNNESSELNRLIEIVVE